MTIELLCKAYGCTLIELDVLDPEDPRYEIMAPDGKQFSGAHSLICFNAADVRERVAQNDLEDCPADCDCRGEAHA